MKSCDICGKESSYLADLLSSHQTKEIKEVCRDCEKVLNEHKSKLQDVTVNILLDWFKRFMIARRESFAAARGERR